MEQKLDLFQNICYAGKLNSFIISTNGIIQKCSLTESDNEDNNIGTINNGKFEIDEIKNLIYCTPDYEGMYKNGCFDCKYMPLCCGMSCPNANIKTGEIRCTKKMINFEEIIIHEYEMSK
ncbi:MAG: SPASM domain-containing protein [Clostridiales bacterium]|nr:SPASM domain-containing protein [Clostridiales bacterium]